ncbi:UDP-N-acetylmuramate dehydrogenase [Desulfonatronovibrio magnus]|uniref:UDP-N-acetylmuramate dehydrogenase n=1 Tax=Desulfonatronovibrio magnus TaxID=698827 RepID=UPI0005EB64A9|nr:UDP-N-acetylmuramate dehydrogenase [Desulfonatronovibrio magnus]
MKIIDRPDLRSMSTLRMGGRAASAVYLENIRDLEKLQTICSELGQDILVVGRGSNILFQDGERDLVLLSWAGRSETRIIKQFHNDVLVSVDAAQSLPGFLRWCAVRGLSGLEGLAGIPGTVGGAVAMNAGSYGSETLAHITGLTVWSLEHGVAELDKEDFTYSYRKFKINYDYSQYIIIRASFQLTQAKPRDVRDRIKENYLKKKLTQPVLEQTAGCVFKNPSHNMAAGQLLDKAGMRGRARKNACFSGRHANFLINMGGAESSEALDLINEATEKVRKKFEVNLELEIRVI